MLHSLDICDDIAQRLKSPEEVSFFMGKQFTGWPLLSFASGLPGIVCFYGMMDMFFEQGEWSYVVHNYLKHIATHLERINDVGASLFWGLAGISFSVYFCSNNGKKYSNLLSKLDRLLIKEIQEGFLKKLPYVSDVFPLQYNLANGLIGVIAYLLFRDDLLPITEECIRVLVQALYQQRSVDSELISPWRKSVNLDKSSPLKNAYGISGVLGVLSKSAIKGIRVEGLYEIIEEIVEWIKSKQVIYKDLIYWHPSAKTSEPNQEAYYWKLDTLSICKCLNIASQALKNKELGAFSRQIILSHLNSFADWPKSIETSFGLGKAGLLSLVYGLGQGEKESVYSKITKLLEEDLKCSYDPLHHFGFQSINFNIQDKLVWSNTPGLFQGAAGIGLSLLEVQGRVMTPSIISLINS